MAATWKKLGYDEDISSATSAATSASTRAGTADSKGVSAGSQAGVADSKGVSAGLAASVADSKAVSAAGAGGEDSVARSMATSAVAQASSQDTSQAVQVSVADSKAVSAGAQPAAAHALNSHSVPTGAVDFDLRVATDLIFMAVNTAASLPADTTTVSVGQPCWVTDTSALYMCTSVS